MKSNKNKPIIYQAKSGAIELRGDVKHETIWASLDQVATLFSRDKSVISRHIKKIFSEEELRRDSVVAFFATTAADGKTYQVEYYNLDIILSVGYRVNSKQATQFRQWATKTLRLYITEGYVINRKQVAQNCQQFLTVIEDIKQLAPKQIQFDTENILELVTAFDDTWLSLDAYDKDKFEVTGITKKSVELTAEQLISALNDFKTELTNKHEASEFFGIENKRDAIEGIIGNVMQTFGGEALYETIEEKAAHLLYFIVKNHSLIDGNKRSGAFVFVWFLSKAGIFNPVKINPSTMTALTLLVAESDPKNKDRMIGFILQLLK